MDTFRLYKEKYIAEKLNFLNQLRYRNQYKVFVNDKPTEEEKLQYDQYENGVWEAMISVINVGNLLGDYVAHCAMDRIKDRDLTCLIVSDNSIEDTETPIFAFTFQRLVVPKFALWADKNPHLRMLASEISYGRVELEKVKRTFAKYGVPCGEIATQDEISDWKLMHSPLEVTVEDLYKYALSEISQFREVNGTTNLR